ncbi:MAG: undecaprenyl/decaprenyl-phosphate alpha-N-acetylglucosaminyl 1-phosphate transferase [Treponema sp.]|jgi:UDP-GlcNAc:undecaprenyl-phosphate GlcNAc-1-phosphate transferase|nr:undecaprenyl/decaprenyl-phosphate alpha-N-acetylglucosaminyl 1-phosphate transferase [Treponema sp.]
MESIEEMTGAVVVFFMSFVSSIIAVALVLRLSHKKAWYDHINERKIHTGDIPRLGGFGFVTAFIIISFIINILSESGFEFRFLPSLLALILIFVSGVYDDFRPLAPRYKLLIQVIAALCVILPGYTFRRFLYLDGYFFSNVGWLRYPLTFFWIIGLTNAMNFIDGLDGLAGGLSFLAALTFALLSVSFSQSAHTFLFCICLAGVVAGFLVFNAPFPQAKIFMGDGGSQFLGFTLALIPLIEQENTPAALPVVYAAGLLAIPIFDTIAAVWRRVRDGRRIDSPDKSHIHHKLINLRFSPRQADFMLWGLQTVLGVLVYCSVKFRGPLSLGLIISAYLITAAFFTVIHFLNRRAVKRFPQAEDPPDEVQIASE